MIAPCNGCADRCADPNCHMTCERYIAYDRERERIRHERVLAHLVNETTIDSTRRMAKYKDRPRGRRHER